MTGFLAAGLYDIWTTQAIIARFWVASGISALSLLLALPPPLRRKWRWHSILALVCSTLFLANAFYLKSTMRGGLSVLDPMLIGYLLIPSMLAAISAFLTRRKKA